MYNFRSDNAMHPVVFGLHTHAKPGSLPNMRNQLVLYTLNQIQQRQHGDTKNSKNLDLIRCDACYRGMIYFLEVDDKNLGFYTCTPKNPSTPYNHPLYNNNLRIVVPLFQRD
eukprot:Lithocolla_globosa_v1_NODE_4822_length_1358_cov_45.254797.p2 type:complete len:112 gc:universal NODE_4822_length_1358_cov_45.254797:537-202(-)